MYEIAELKLGDGWLGISPIPGRTGTYDLDLTAILTWGANLVFTMTTASELERVGAAGLRDDLMAAGIAWRACANAS